MNLKELYKTYQSEMDWFGPMVKKIEQHGWFAKEAKTLPGASHYLIVTQSEMAFHAGCYIRLTTSFDGQHSIVRVYAGNYQSMVIDDAAYAVIGLLRRFRKS